MIQEYLNGSNENQGNGTDNEDSGSIKTVDGFIYQHFNV